MEEATTLHTPFILTTSPAPVGPAGVGRGRRRVLLSLVVVMTRSTLVGGREGGWKGGRQGLGEKALQEQDHLARTTKTARQGVLDVEVVMCG